MPYIYYNPNPKRSTAGDCVIRAICKLTEEDWDTVYSKVTLYGFLNKEMPSSNYVWGSLLKTLGYSRHIIPDTCPDCYTVRDFCKDNPRGTYLLATGAHVVTVTNGDYYDTWDSGNEVPVYYWTKGE